jgi:DNA-binding NtrC family response regulator
MDSPTLLCVDDRPQMLELRKAALESKGYCVKLASSGYTAIKTLEETSVAAVPPGVQTGRHGRGSHSLPHQATVSQSSYHLLSAYSEMPERILWLVDDYVMKSELPERLLPIIERAHGRSDERCQRSGAGA